MNRNRHEAVVMPRSFMANVFSWMFGALAITAFISYYFSHSPELMASLISPTGGLSTLGWVVLIAPVGLALLMSFGINKLSAAIMTFIFIIYSLLMGMSLSFIFLMYTANSIYVTFGVSAAMFGVMALVGYFTTTDLTKFGSIMMMGLVGIIIASVINFFMHSETMGYIISIVGVLVFTGLTAYDVQKLKNIAGSLDHDPEMKKKATIMGALNLYLDFINLFLFLLRFLGDRK
ncbi:MAG: Bax inhibitor-1/YccA family protein [Bacteroidetes bacterium]|nr:Bax inhibitor-1/YccA family protein [Bacteroidota bacterium]MBU1719980.1 Bax inhibitor-1/YccA family protein [Bacteroidota bacterium]